MGAGWNPRVDSKGGPGAGNRFWHLEKEKEKSELEADRCSWTSRCQGPLVEMAPGI